ncbi:hypothetical protein R1sor_021223 [Riccia sorocarpa]|uniref:Reverse transcriptase domain-containing protein n=1 Tax=Riccia sorocarpa TaxID=122646 RepID=A0ABD3GI94_9MARC
MAHADFKLDTSEVAIHSKLKRLSEAQQAEPPTRRSRQVQLVSAPQQDTFKELMQKAVVTTFYGPSPQIDQFRACIGDAWGKLHGVQILQARAMARRGMFFTRFDSHLSQLKVLAHISSVIKGVGLNSADPIPLCPPGPTDIAIEEFQHCNQGPMAIQDSQSSVEATRREGTHLQPMNSVQLLRQQKIGAWETSRRGDMQPMEEELQSAAIHGQVLALQELHVSKATLRFITRVAAPAYRSYSPDPIPATGGTAILVSQECEVLESFFHPSLDFGWVLVRYLDYVFSVVSVYSPNHSSGRVQLWKALRETLPFKPWILCGDFNMVQVRSDASDHFPISLALATPEMVTFSSMRGTSYFKVDHTILQDNHLLEQLKDVWARLDQHPEFSICSYLQAWQEQLQMIQARQQTRDRQLKLLPAWERQLAQFHDANDFSPGIVQQIAELSAQVVSLRELQQHKWRVWSRIKYLRDGDTSSAYFLRKFMRQVARNRLRQLQLETGEILSEPEAIIQSFASSYSSLYSNPQLTDDELVAMHSLLKTMSPQLSLPEQSFLASIPTTLDLTDIVHSLPSVMPPQFLRGAIKLLPKTKFPIKFGEWRPITLLSIHCKILAKVLANRLALLLPKIVPGQQADFVRGRSTLDNALLLQLVHEVLKRRHQAAAFVKVDLSKAYDRLNVRRAGGHSRMGPALSVEGSKQGRHYNLSRVSIQSRCSEVAAVDKDLGGGTTTTALVGGSHLVFRR